MGSVAGAAWRSMVPLTAFRAAIKAASSNVLFSETPRPLRQHQSRLTLRLIICFYYEMEADLLDQLPTALIRTVRVNLAHGEPVLLVAKGAFKEALICTDRRVMIAKSGFMTGQMFGSDVFQLPYHSIASAEVKFRIFSGYFGISTGGMQNTPKSYWSQDKNLDPSKAPNCIGLNNKEQAVVFRQACAFIMERIALARQPVALASPPVSEIEGLSAQVERLWKLRTDGAPEHDHSDHALLD